MNLFILSECPLEAAKWSVDRHCGKILIETAQVLCGAFWMQRIAAPYRLSHKNHPISSWCRESLANFEWTVKYGKALGVEFQDRYGKIHKSLAVVEWCHSNKNQLIFPLLDRTPFAQAMPDEFRDKDAVTAYRNYYKFGKVHLHSWKQNRPNWID